MRVEQYLKLRGVVRVQIVDRKTGEIVGDSGELYNAIQTIGWEQAIVNQVIGSGTTKNANFLCLGSTALTINSSNFSAFVTAAGTDSQNGKNINAKSSVAAAGGATARMEGLWLGANYVVGPGDDTINAIAITDGSGLNGTEVHLAGVTFSSSTWSTDQDVKATYELQFTQG